MVLGVQVMDAFVSPAVPDIVGAPGAEGGMPDTKSVIQEGYPVAMAPCKRSICPAVKGLVKHASGE